MVASDLNDDERAELARCLAPLRELLEEFVDGRVDGEQFGIRFFRIYQDLPGIPSERVFDTMERFFGAVDDHVPYPDLRDAPDDLTTEELQRRAHALMRLAGFR